MTTPSLRDAVAEAMFEAGNSLTGKVSVGDGVVLLADAALKVVAEHIQPRGSWLTILNDDGSYHCNHPDIAGCPLPNHITEPLYRLSPALADALTKEGEG